MKKIIIIGILFALVDVAVVSIFKVLDVLDGDTFSKVIIDSLSVIGILVILSLLVKIILKIIE